ncbi:hypothetical protein M3T53_03340 [Actinomyces sp. B33]|uniref:hypothetical protein n=1 Tax=Actinomyces sp. B33 TaxID=2942131 RepID=UPI002341FA17|nr:hypothetical protein [Actinomyces sp. B33]MDC4232751.1 hypothetical protein [Actinomyces sp. B33]
MTPAPPAAVTAVLPDSDRRAPAEPLEDGRWLVAGSYALIVVDDPGDGPAAVVDSAMWYEVASARWEAATRRFSCAWVDPARTGLVGVTRSADPAAFMGAVAEGVDRSLVVRQEARADNGTRITGWVRRREDGALFSVLTADGPLDGPAQTLADRLEAQVRDDVGLD